MIPLTAECRRTFAMDALTGLSVGDAFGNQAVDVPKRVVVPDARPGTWAWTDDTQMACSIVDVLDRRGAVDQDELADCFADRIELSRSYGKGALHLLRRVRDGGYWRQISAEQFNGLGSWGNGGAMRVTPLGAYFADDMTRTAREAAASSEITHAHPEGIAGGVAAAVAACYAASLREQEVEVPVTGVLEAPLAYLTDGQVRRGLAEALRLLDRTPEEAAAVLGNGSRTSAQDTVPFVLWVVATRFDDYEAAIRTCVAAGGDMDTTAAIAGGILAAHHGRSCVPAMWLRAREPLPDWVPA